ncbi:MAG TPA: VOC family protein [Micromonosporaceae bacterium]|nr:VOC family protein [Micromonosporaceae bacterium]
MANQVVHFELPVDNPERAQAFYRDAFGWAMNPVPGMDYVTIETTPTDERGQPTQPGAVNGGMFLRQQLMGTPIITIQVDDVDQVLEQVERLGGAVVQTRRKVGGMGYTGYFSDPEGNILGLWQDAG